MKPTLNIVLDVYDIPKIVFETIVVEDDLFEPKAGL